MCYTSNMMRFIMFLEACGQLGEPSHPHPPNREFWAHTFNAEVESLKVFETFYKTICMYPKKLFAYDLMSSSLFDELLELVRTNVRINGLYFRIQSVEGHNFSLNIIQTHAMASNTTMTQTHILCLKPVQIRILSQHPGARCGAIFYRVV